MMKRKRYLYLAMVFLLSVVLLMVTFAAAGAQDGSKTTEAAEKAPRAPAHGPEDTGGPDVFGYTYVDSAEAGGPVYEWIEITGTNNITFGDDTRHGPIPIGFSFKFYGADFTDIWAGSNGWMSIGAVDPGANDLTNVCPLPGTSGNENIIAGIWDDLDNDTGTPIGTGWYQSYAPGACPYNSYSGACFIAEWKGMYHWVSTGPADDLTFEIILFDDDSIIIQMADASDELGSGSTTGIENSDGTIGLTYGSCNTADSITDTLAIEFAPADLNIQLDKTVALDSDCVGDDTMVVDPGTAVYYCYEATNTGYITFTMHDLVDSELGQLLDGYSLTLGPGSNSSTYTGPITISQTTVNTATWTAYNENEVPTDVISSTDSATVYVNEPAPLVCNGSTVGFDVGIPTDWTVVNNVITNTVNWASVADCGESGNFTGGSGEAACASSDFQDGAMYDTELWSPPIDLSSTSQITLTYLANYQNFASVDFLDLDISTDGGSNWTNLLSWNEDHGTFQGTPGEAVVVDLSDYAFEDEAILRWHYYDPGTATSTDWYAQIDDVALSCFSGPAIEFEKTVGLDPSVCAVDDAIDVFAGTDVYYCYAVQNTGTVTLTRHDLVDSEIGTILNNFQYDLGLGTGIFLTATASIDVTTVNTATWTAYNPGNNDLVSGTDTATVNVVFTPEIEVDPASMFSQQAPDVQVTLPLTISNVGDADLDWELFEESPVGVVPSSPSDVSRAYTPEVVTSREQCAVYENYAGIEPIGYAEVCLGLDSAPQEVHRNPSVDPTDMAYALDVRNGNFVSHLLNDFSGQTIVGPNAHPIFAMDFDETATTLYGIDNTTRELGTLNLADGTFASIAAVSGIPSTFTISGLTIDPADGTAYVSTVDGVTMNLYMLDLGTGAATLIGTDATVPLLIDIAIGPQGVMYGHDIGTDSIYTINTSTGAATLVGPTGLASNFAQGMDFDNADGTLYVWSYQGGGTNTYGTVDLATGAVTPLSVNNPLGEFEGSTQTFMAPGCEPSDIPWLSAAPTSGTTAPGASQVVDVTFDSTGMSVGTYTATLCIESNDYYGTLVRVPVTLEIPEIAINLVKTVGLDSATCAATNSISVPAGGVVVYYCYEVTNNGVFTLSTHSLVDTELGTLFTDVDYDLGPGQSIDTVTMGETFSATISATTVNTATWTAVEPDGRPTEDTATATVTIAPPTGVALSSFGELKPIGSTPIWMSLLVLVLLVGATLTWRRKTNN